MSETIEGAARNLANHLDEIGVKGTVGHSDTELFVYLEKLRDRKRVPKGFQGFPVSAHFVGKIKPL